VVSLRVNSNKNVTGNERFIHLEMLPEERRLLLISCVQGDGTLA
jgi:hypothetical protein